MPEPYATLVEETFSGSQDSARDNKLRQGSEKSDELTPGDSAGTATPGGSAGTATPGGANSHSVRSQQSSVQIYQQTRETPGDNHWRNKINISDSDRKNVKYQCITQVVLGILFLIINPVSVGLNRHTFNVSGHGIWGGIVYIVVGMMGSVAIRTKGRSLLNLVRVANIVTCLVVLASMGLAAAAIDEYFTDSQEQVIAVLIIDIMMLIFGILVLVSAVLNAVMMKTILRSPDAHPQAQQSRTGKCLLCKWRKWRRQFMFQFHNTSDSSCIHATDQNDGYIMTRY